MKNELDQFTNCDICSSITYKNSLGVCNDCLETDQRDFASVKDNIGLNETITIEDLSERTGVPVKRIKAWVERGRLSHTSISN